MGIIVEKTFQSRNEPSQSELLTMLLMDRAQKNKLKYKDHVFSSEDITRITDIIFRFNKGIIEASRYKRGFSNRLMEMSFFVLNKLNEDPEKFVNNYTWEIGEIFGNIDYWNGYEAVKNAIKQEESNLINLKGHLNNAKNPERKQLLQKKVANKDFTIRELRNKLKTMEDSWNVV